MARLSLWFLETRWILIPIPLSSLPYHDLVIYLAGIISSLLGTGFLIKV